MSETLVYAYAHIQKKDEIHIFKNSTKGLVLLKFNQMRRKTNGTKDICLNKLQKNLYSQEGIVFFRKFLQR